MRGTIIKLGNGQYRIFAEVGRDPATRKRRRITERMNGTYREAQRRLSEIRTALDKGTHIASDSSTLQQFVESWWPSKRTAVAPTTAEGYRRLLDSVILPALGRRPVQKVTPGEVGRFLSGIVNRGAPGQADHAFVLLRLVFNTAVRQGAVVRSPMTGVERPRVPRKEMRILYPIEWQRVQEYLLEHRPDLMLPFWTLITSGLRRSELCGLKWADFDEPARLLHVQRAVHVLRGGRYVEREPKTSRARRIVALDASTTSMLAEHRRESERIGSLFGRALEDSDYIFGRSDTRKPCHPQVLSRAWQRTVQALGLPSIRLHDLRHSAASLLLATGADPKLISERLGHSSVGFTLTVYGHLMPGAQAEAAEKLAAMLGNGRAQPVLAAG